MRILFPALAALFPTACSDTPSPPSPKPPEPPPFPISGRQWPSNTCTVPRASGPPTACPFTIRSLIVPDVKPEKRQSWRLGSCPVSEAMGRARTYTWSAVETENVHKGVFPGQQESWHPGGPNQSFSPALLKVDTTEALIAAINISRPLSEQARPAPPRQLSAQLRDRQPLPKSCLASPLGRLRLLRRIHRHRRRLHRQSRSSRLTCDDSRGCPNEQTISSNDAGRNEPPRASHKTARSMRKAVTATEGNFIPSKSTGDYTRGTPEDRAKLGKLVRKVGS